MLAKIKRFNAKVGPNEPLQTSAFLDKCYIERNGERTYFEFLSNSAAQLELTNLNITIPVDFTEEFAIIANLWNIEGLLSLHFLALDRASINVDSTTKPNTLIVTVVSEDGDTTTKYRVFKNQLGAIAGPILHSFISIVNNGQIDIDKKSYVYEPLIRTGFVERMPKITTDITAISAISGLIVNQSYILYTPFSNPNSYAMLAKYLGSDVDNGLFFEILDYGEVSNIVNPKTFVANSSVTRNMIMSQINVADFYVVINGNNSASAIKIANGGSSYLYSPRQFSLNLGNIQTINSFLIPTIGPPIANPDTIINAIVDSQVIISEDFSFGDIQAFTTIEAAILNTQKPHYKLTRSGVTIYYEESLVTEETSMDNAKNNLDDLYVDLLFNKIAIPLNSSYTKLRKLDANKFEDTSTLLSWLNTNSIEHYDITGRLIELIDDDETARINEDTYIRNINSTNDTGFIKNDLIDFGSKIAEMLLPTIQLIENTDGSKMYPQTIKWLQYIKDRDDSILAAPELGLDILAKVKYETYRDFIKDTNNSSFFLNHYYPKQFDFIKARLIFTIDSIVASNDSFQYVASINDLRIIVDLMNSLKSIWYGQKQKQSTFNIEAAVNTFVMQLHNLKQQQNVQAVQF